MTPEQILLLYSTPGLKVAELSYDEKRLHLLRLGIKRIDADVILEQLYPAEHRAHRLKGTDNGPTI